MIGTGGTDRDLLLLCHRIPYPPDKGDKIRSFRWMTALAARYRVHLAAFVDDADDWQHAPRLREICDEVCLVPLQARRAKLRSLPALLTGAPLTVTYYRDARMAAWIDDLMQRRRIDRIVVYSSAMAQYAVGSDYDDIRRVIDFVDVDSDKWRQYAERTRGPMAWVYRREARRLLAYDVEVARAFDVSLFVSQVEVDCFRSLAGLDQEVGADLVCRCGIRRDTRSGSQRWNTSRMASIMHSSRRTRHDDRPTGQTGRRLCSLVRWTIGPMWMLCVGLSNRSGHCSVHRNRDAVLYVVGSRPGAEITALACDNVVVTGRVPDVRPYLQYAAAVVAPMRIARGIQNKVLEGMAMARPVVLTSLGLEGIEAVHGQLGFGGRRWRGIRRACFRGLAGTTRRHGSRGKASRAAALSVVARD